MQDSVNDAIVNLRVIPDNSSIWNSILLDYFEQFHNWRKRIPPQSKRRRSLFSQSRSLRNPFERGFNNLFCVLDSLRYSLEFDFKRTGKDFSDASFLRYYPGFEKFDWPATRDTRRHKFELIHVFLRAALRDPSEREEYSHDGRTHNIVVRIDSDLRNEASGFERLESAIFRWNTDNPAPIYTTLVTPRDDGSMELHEFKVKFERKPFDDQFFDAEEDCIFVINAKNDRTTNAVRKKRFVLIQTEQKMSENPVKIQGIKFFSPNHPLVILDCIWEAVYKAGLAVTDGPPPRRTE